MNIKFFAGFVLLTASSVAAAQDARIRLPDFAGLADRARDSVDIALGPWMLHSASMFLDGDDADDQATRQLLNAIQSIQVRSFEFETDHAYSSADLDEVRKQLNAPGWTALLKVHDRNRQQDVDMYMFVQNEQTRGFALIDSEPRQFTIINIVGSIKTSDLPKLEQHLHLDKLRLPAATAPF